MNAVIFAIPFLPTPPDPRNRTWPLLIDKVLPNFSIMLILSTNKFIDKDFYVDWVYYFDCYWKNSMFSSKFLTWLYYDSLFKQLVNNKSSIS